MDSQPIVTAMFGLDEQTAYELKLCAAFATLLAILVACNYSVWTYNKEILSDVYTRPDKFKLRHDAQYISHVITGVDHQVAAAQAAADAAADAVPETGAQQPKADIYNYASSIFASANRKRRVDSDSQRCRDADASDSGADTDGYGDAHDNPGVGVRRGPASTRRDRSAAGIASTLPPRIHLSPATASQAASASHRQPIVIPDQHQQYQQRSSNINSGFGVDDRSNGDGVFSNSKSGSSSSGGGGGVRTVLQFPSPAHGRFPSTSEFAATADDDGQRHHDAAAGAEHNFDDRHRDNEEHQHHQRRQQRQRQHSRADDDADGPSSDNGQGIGYAADTNPTLRQRNVQRGAATQRHNGGGGGREDAHISSKPPLAPAPASPPARIRSINPHIASAAAATGGASSPSTSMHNSGNGSSDGSNAIRSSNLRREGIGVANGAVNDGSDDRDGADHDLAADRTEHSHSGAAGAHAAVVRRDDAGEPMSIRPITAPLAAMLRSPRQPDSTRSLGITSLGVSVRLADHLAASDKDDDDDGTGGPGTDAGGDAASLR